MSLPVFPGNLPGITWPVDKEASFATLAQAAPNGSETAISQARNPLWKWTLTYESLRDDPADTPYLINGYTEYQTLQGFQLAAAGAGGVFLLNDPSDNSVGPAVLSGAPNLKAQLQVVNDGATSPTYYSPIQRNFGGQFLEDITDLNGAIAVHDNGVLKALTTDYTIVGPGLALPGYSFMGLALKWVSPPTGPVTAAFNFYFRCRFAEDAMAVSRFMQKFLTAGGSEAGDSPSVVIKSARVPSA